MKFFITSFILLRRHNPLKKIPHAAFHANFNVSNFNNPFCFSKPPPGTASTSLLCQKAAISLLLQKRTQFVAPKSTVSTQALAPKSSTQVVVQKEPNNTASTDAKIITVSTQAVVPKTQKAQSALRLLRQNAKKHCQHSGGCAKKPKNTQPQRQRQGVRQDNRALNTDSLPGSWPFQPTTLQMIAWLRSPPPSTQRPAAAAL